MKIMWGILIFLVGIGAKIMWDEEQREVSYEQMVVEKSGCVTGSYKGHNVYDCSVLVKHEDGKEEKLVLKMGLLPGDVIYKKTAKEYGMAHGYSYYTRYKD